MLINPFPHECRAVLKGYEGLSVQYEAFMFKTYFYMKVMYKTDEKLGLWHWCSSCLAYG